MRKVTLWEMKPTEMIVGGDEIVRHQRDSFKAFPFSRDGEWAMPLDTTVQVERIPIHTISKMERGERHDEYIAIEPKLREVLEVPFVTQVMKAEKAEAEWREYAHAVDRRRTEFNKKPWYHRIYLAIKAEM